jgi:hypothetical protein
VNPARQAVYEHLAADTTLTGMLADGTGGIYHQRAPQDARTPFVLFSKQAGSPGWDFDGAFVQGDVWLVKAVDQGASATTAETIAARIDVLLNPAVGMMLSTGEPVAVLRETDVDYVEDDTDADRSYRHTGAQYRLVY